MTVALAIPHTPWVPARVESLRRLSDALRLYTYETTHTKPSIDSDEPWTGHTWECDFRVFRDREPNWSWSARMWRWGLETGADHLLQLNDDAIVAPNFWPSLRAMLAAVPEQVIGLQVAHPAAQRLALEGHRWFTTSEGLVGVGYVLPRAPLAEFLEWRRDKLARGAIHEITEDTLIGIWCLSTGRKIWHPIPTIVDHDTSIASEYQNDNHANRRSRVTWRDGDVVGFESADLERADWWRCVDGLLGDKAPPHLGRFYDSTPHHARAWLRDCPDELVARMLADKCPAPYSRWLR